MRLKRFKEKLKGEQAGVFLVEDNVNRLYIAGMPLSAGSLVIGEECRLFVDGRYIEAAQSQSDFPVALLEKGAVESFLKELGGPVAVDGGLISASRAASLREAGIELELLPGWLSELRAVKDELEIERLRAAAALAASGFDLLKTLLRDGVRENELARQLRLYWTEHGGEGPSFEPVVGFGAHTSMPHYETGEGELKPGDAVQIDIGVQLDRYQSDMSRVLFHGQPTEKMMEIYQIVREAMERAIETVRPGVTAGEVDAAARDHIVQAGYGDQFPHSLGHGVGLEVHEAPWIRRFAPWSEQLLEENMVFTIEPGIYLPGLGGVRLEDTGVVTATGWESLTQRPL